MKRLAIFDLDDTLVDTSHIYWESRSAFLQCLAENGFDREEVLEYFEEIDGGHIAQYGYVPERYEKSMFVAYRGLCERAKLVPDEQLASCIRDAGRIVQQKMPDLIGGAIELLDGARALGMRVVLVTRGVESVQQSKIRAHDLAHHFDRVEIVQAKDAALFRRVMIESGFSEADTWIIGDSVRSDINPGVQAGANCILYLYTHHSYYWRQEYGVTPLGAFYIAQDLKDVLPILCNPKSGQRVNAV